MLEWITKLRTRRFGDQTRVVSKRADCTAPPLANTQHAVRSGIRPKASLWKLLLERQVWLKANALSATCSEIDVAAFGRLSNFVFSRCISSIYPPQHQRWRANLANTLIWAERIISKADLMSCALVPVNVAHSLVGARQPASGTHIRRQAAQNTARCCNHHFRPGALINENSPRALE